MCWGVNWSQVDRYFEESKEEEQNTQKQDKQIEVVPVKKRTAWNEVLSWLKINMDNKC